MNYLINPDISEEMPQYMKHNYCLIYGFMEPVLEDCLLILM